MNPIMIFSQGLYFLNISKSEFHIFTLNVTVIWNVVKISLPAILCFANGRHMLYHSDSFTKVAKFFHCSSEDSLQQTDVNSVCYHMITGFKP